MMTRLDKLIHNSHSILAIFIVMFAFTLFYVLLFKGMPDNSKDVVLFILGAVSTNLTQVVSYYFGSSKDAGDKRSGLRTRATDTPKE